MSKSTLAAVAGIGGGLIGGVLIVTVATLYLSGGATSTPAAVTEAPAAPQAASEDPAVETEIVRVIDGDTVAVAPVEGRLDATDDDGTEHVVRLLGIDAPEMHYDSDDEPDCGAQEATDHLEEILPAGQPVLITWDTRADRVDQYGRSLGYVRASSSPTGDAGSAQVAGGYAVPYVPHGEPRTDLTAQYEREHTDAVAELAGPLATCGTERT